MPVLDAEVIDSVSLARVTCRLGQVEERPLDDKLQQLLQDLGDALVEAISDSSEINDSLRELKRSGYSLYLVVDAKGASGRRRGETREERVRRAVVEAQTRTSGDPVFRIDGKDLSFLRSIGIDPTRKSRGRRSGSG
jgi:hypothetical protein